MSQTFVAGFGSGQMQVGLLRCTCKCGHVFDAEIVEHAPFDVALAAMKAIRCPLCRSKKIFLGGEKPGRPDLSTTIDTRAEWWRKNGDVGASSLAIWSALSGRPHGERFDVDAPHDCGDYGRCESLLEIIPEWRTRLAEVAEKYPIWRGFVTRWDEIEELSKRKEFEKAYALIKAARAEDSAQ